MINLLSEHDQTTEAFIRNAEFQPGLICNVPTRAKEQRAHFSTRNFASDYSLTGPIAVNFFVAQWDSSVPPPPKKSSVYDLMYM